MINVIPKPAHAVENEGSFTIERSSSVFFAPEFESVKKFFVNPVNEAIGAVLSEDANSAIRFELDPSLAEEGYTLTVTEDALLVKASAAIGAFYAIQTLRQVANIDITENAEEISVPCVEIKDEPRFGWRGLHLDCSRHFWSVNEIKRLLDIMGILKLNVFHWHLTDDQGWRLEIKKYPLLTEIGAKRKNTQNSGWNAKKVEMTDEPYEGFYSQEEAKDIVAYAAQRGITVIPEIDMPAHLTAAIASYNYLACREIPCEVMWYLGGVYPTKVLKIKDNSWNRSACLGKETTYQFIYDVLDEVCEIFPAPYFHIGGDEAPRDEWKKCPHCQKMIKEKGLKNEDELQGYFTNCVNEYIKSKGKRLIGWNEILNAGNLDKSVIGQYWTPQRDKHSEKYVNNGGQLIMSRHQSFYFDMNYSQRPLNDTYNFEPVHQGVLPESEKNVLGVEGEMWTEFIRDTEKLHMNYFPRAHAVAEIGWTPKKERNFKDFVNRWHIFRPIMDKYGLNYAEDEIMMPKKWKRAYYTRNFYSGNNQLEVEKNRELKAKK